MPSRLNLPTGVTKCAGIRKIIRFCPMIWKALRPIFASRAKEILAKLGSGNYLDERTTVDGVTLVFRARLIANVGAGTGLAVMIYESALKNVKVFVEFMVLYFGHAVPRIPLDEHGQLPGLRVLPKYLAPRAWSKFLPFDSLAVGIADKFPIVIRFHIVSDCACIRENRVKDHILAKGIEV